MIAGAGAGLATTLAAVAIFAVPALAGGPAGSPATAANRQAAIADAAEHLADVVAPAGAVPGDGMSGTGPAGDHLLAGASASAWAQRTWTVSGDPAAILAGVKSQLPAGWTQFGTGSGSGPQGSSQSVMLAWPRLPHVLDLRDLEVTVATAASGETLTAEAQSEWVLARAATEVVPDGVARVVITDGFAGQAPLLARTVTRPARIARLVQAINGFDIIQPVSINCPFFTPTSTVTASFRSPSGALLARAKVSADATMAEPTSTPGWACEPIRFAVHGRDGAPLAGNLIHPLREALDGAELPAPRAARG